MKTIIVKVNDNVIVNNYKEKRRLAIEGMQALNYGKAAKLHDRIGVFDKQFFNAQKDLHIKRMINLVRDFDQYVLSYIER